MVTHIHTHSLTHQLAFVRFTATLWHEEQAAAASAESKAGALRRLFVITVRFPRILSIYYQKSDT